MTGVQTCALPICYIADLLLLDGDPLKDIDLVVHTKNLHVIMKEGSLYKNDAATAVLEHTVAIS